MLSSNKNSIKFLPIPCAKEGGEGGGGNPGETSPVFPFTGFSILHIK